MRPRARVQKKKQRGGRSGRVTERDDDEQLLDQTAEAMAPGKPRPAVTNARSKDHLLDPAKLAAKSLARQKRLENQRQQRPPKRVVAPKPCTPATLAHEIGSLHATAKDRLVRRFGGECVVEVLVAAVARAVGSGRAVAVVSDGPTPAATNLREVMGDETVAARAMAGPLLDDEAGAAASIRRAVDPLADAGEEQLRQADGDRRGQLVQRVALFLKRSRLGREGTQVEARDLPALLPVMGWTAEELGCEPCTLEQRGGKLGKLWRHMGSKLQWVRATLLPRLEEAVAEAAAARVQQQRAAVHSLPATQVELLRDHHADSLRADKELLERRVAAMRRVAQAAVRPDPTEALHTVMQDEGLDAEARQLACDLLRRHGERQVGPQQAQQAQQGPEDVAAILEFVQREAAVEGTPLSSSEVVKLGMQTKVFDAFPVLRDIDPRRNLGVDDLARLQERLASCPREDYRAAVLAALGPEAWSEAMEEWWTTPCRVGRAYNAKDRARQLLGGRADGHTSVPGSRWYAAMEREWPDMRMRLEDEALDVPRQLQRPEPMQTRSSKRRRTG